MEIKGFCHICGAMASGTCKLCGKLVCKEHVNSRNVCTACAAGRG